MPKREREQKKKAKILKSAPPPSQEEDFQPLVGRTKRKKLRPSNPENAHEYVECTDSDSDESTVDQKKHFKSPANESSDDTDGNSGSSDDSEEDFEVEDEDVDSEEVEVMDEEAESDIGELNPAAEDQKMDVSTKTPTEKPHFPQLSAKNLTGSKTDYREIKIPYHRYGMLKEHWMEIYNPIVKHLGLQIRFNVKSKNVEMRSCSTTKDIGAMQKAEDFITAFTYGFEIQDALALVRLDDLYLERFKIQDVKTLKGDNLSRCVARIVGSGGKTKFTIENVTKTRIVINHDNISLLGTYHNLATARRAICSLIMGNSPGKVYSTMRAVAAKSTSRL